MVRSQIQLTETQIKALKKLAAVKHSSMTELIRLGVDLVLQAKGMTDGEENQERALALFGRFRSRKSNISKEHDRYLLDILKASLNYRR